MLHEHLASACDGAGSLVLLAGEAGIGKTTLLHDLGVTAADRDAIVAVGHCMEAGGSPAFTPWPEVLAALTDHAGLPPPFGAGVPAGSTFQLMATVVAHLRKLAETRPVVILLDDLHWADRDALLLLESTARSLPTAPVLIIGAYRTDSTSQGRPFFELLPELRRGHHTSFLTIGTLNQEAAGEMVAARGGRCSDALAAYLHTRSGGHPLFLVEILRDLSERQVLHTNPAGDLLPPSQDEPLPALLLHVITHRVQRLGPDAETLLLSAAVAGESWRPEVIETVLAWGEDRFLWALELAVHAEIILPVPGTDTYRFGHGLIRQALYDRLTTHRRRRLHQKVAEALTRFASGADEQHDALAYHFTAAGIWDAAARHSLAAGDLARERLAGHSALLAYQSALEAASRLPGTDGESLRLALLERQGRTLFLIGNAAGAELTFRGMLEAANAGRDQRAAARALVWLSYAQRRQYHALASLASGEEALQAADAVSDKSLQALAHWNLGHHHEIYGPLPAADEHARAAVDLARVAGEPDVLSRSLQIRSILGVWQGEYAAAVSLARESLTLAHQGHDGLAFAAAHWRLGLALGEVGRYSEALRVLQTGRENAETIGERYYLTKLLNTLGWLHLEVGSATSAKAWNLLALDTVRSSQFDGVTEAERYTLLNLASDALAVGDLVTAAAYLREFAPLRDQRDSGRHRYLNRAQLTQAELSLAQGDFVTARNGAEAAGRHASELNMRKNLAQAHLLAGRALLGLRRTQLAVTSLQAGVALADELGHGRLRWQGRLWLGDAVTALRQDALPIFGEASGLLHRLARSVVEDDLRDALLSSPEAVALKARLAQATLPAPALPAGLTTREVDVLRLLMEHHTDREIAGVLFLSHRTISTHVANILGKLGVTNRRDAITVAADLRLP